MSKHPLAAANLIKKPSLCDTLYRTRRAHCHCISTDKSSKRSDPAIFSQLQKLSQSLHTRYWSPWRFMDNRVVTVRNTSNEFSAVNTWTHDKNTANNIDINRNHHKPRTAYLFISRKRRHRKTTHDGTMCFA